MKKLYLILFICLTSFNLTRALAESIYPIPTWRFYGMDQQNVGSCQAHAEVNALEHSFATLGYPMHLSVFYRNSIVMARRKPEARNENHGLSQEEINYLTSKNVDFIPNFMFPEDGQGRARDPRRKRPSVLKHAVINEGYMNEWPSVGFKEIYYDFRRFIPNTKLPHLGTVDTIKDHVRKKLALVISVHGDLLDRDNFDRYTGLLKVPFTTEMITLKSGKPYYENINHALAIVGFDDSLYGGQGAFIIRNSWAAGSKAASIRKRIPNPEELAQLKSFRLKISQKNLPDYFAIPYAYINSLISSSPKPSCSRCTNGVSSYRILDANYKTWFYLIEKFRPEYKIYHIPYTCNYKFIASAINTFLKGVGEFKEGSEKSGMATMRKAYNREMQNYGDRGSSRISIAKLSSSTTLPDKNRLNDFLDGKLNSYYCDFYFGSNHEILELFPTKADQDHPKFKNLLQASWLFPNSEIFWLSAFKVASCRFNQASCKPGFWEEL